jgi:hypothetical protein
MRVPRIVNAIKYVVFVTILAVAMFTLPSSTAQSRGDKAPSCWVHLDILDRGLAAGVIRLLQIAACWLRLWPRALRAPVM